MAGFLLMLMMFVGPIGMILLVTGIIMRVKNKDESPSVEDSSNWLMIIGGAITGIAVFIMLVCASLA
mgnify:CR=1 FL=1